MSFVDIAAFLLVPAAIVNVVSTVILVTAAIRHRWPALEERAGVAVVLAVVACGAAVLALSRLRVFSLPSDLAISILVIGLLLVSVPSVVWLAAFWAGRFDEEEGPL